MLEAINRADGGRLREVVEEQASPTPPVFLAPGPAPAAHGLRDIPVLISCGAEMNDLRNQSARIVHRLDEMLMMEWRTRWTVRQWDYRDDLPREETAGHFGDRSLGMVSQSDVVICIAGHTVPETTHAEISELVRLRNIGQAKELWLYVRRSGTPQTTVPAGHVTLSDLLGEIDKGLGTEYVYHDIRDDFDFLTTLLIQFVPYLQKRVGSAFGPIGSGAES
jgi:hypothetical protein